jgi:NAD/NADP transhydrogenase alpha subunit
MAVSNKHLATLLLGVAGAFAAYKYTRMTELEKQKLAESLKDKFNKLKDEAEASAGTARNYFNDLKNKASDLLKEHLPNAEKHFDDLFNSTRKDETSTATGSQGSKGL